MRPSFEDFLSLDLCLKLVSDVLKFSRNVEMLQYSSVRQISRFLIFKNEMLPASQWFIAQPEHVLINWRACSLQWWRNVAQLAAAGAVSDKRNPGDISIFSQFFFLVAWWWRWERGLCVSKRVTGCEDVMWQPRHATTVTMSVSDITVPTYCYSRTSGLSSTLYHCLALTQCFLAEISCRNNTGFPSNSSLEQPSDWETSPGLLTQHFYCPALPSSGHSQSQYSVAKILRSQSVFVRVLHHHPQTLSRIAEISSRPAHLTNGAFLFWRPV